MPEVRAILTYVDNHRMVMLSTVVVVVIVSSYFQTEPVCRCWMGRYTSSRVGASLLVDLLALSRAVIAFFAKEKSPPWLAYSLLCLTSPMWIEPIFKGAILFHDSNTGDTLFRDLLLGHSH